MFSQLVSQILDSFFYLLIYSLIQPRDFFSFIGDKTIIKICQEEEFCARADPQIILFTNEKKRHGEQKRFSQGHTAIYLQDKTKTQTFGY